MKKINKIGLLISAVAIMLVLVLRILGMLQTWENKFYDFKFKMRGSIPHSDKVIIIAIDNESLQTLGNWPWPRSIVARGISNLAKAGAKVIGTDIMYFEKDKNRPIEDVKLAQAVKKANCVVGSMAFESNVENTVKSDGEDKVNIIETDKEILSFPIPALAKAYKSLGFVNADPDMYDGVLRRVTTDKLHDGKNYHSFNKVISALYLDKNPDDITVHNSRLVNFPGETGTYTYYSFTDIYDGYFPKEWLENKIALIGSTALGTFDHYTMPYCSMYPGVEFHASAIDNIINNNFIKEVPFVFTLILMILFAAITGQVYFHLKPVISFIFFILSVFVYFFISQWVLFVAYNLHLDFLKPGLTLIFSYVGILGYRFNTEEKEKRWIKKTFSYYLSPDVIQDLTTSPDKLKLGGEKKELTVLFSDIRGFTSISEELEPEETVHLLNEYLSAMTEIVFKHSGTLDKFIGDAVMAFWGAPIPQADHPERAVNCAFEMMEKLKVLQEKWKSENKRPFDIGIGINTGEMIVGNLGSYQRMDYTVIGDKVNTASRLEGLNKQYGTHIIISESTYEFVQDKIEAKPLGSVKVKGKEKALNIFEAIGKK